MKNLFTAIVVILIYTGSYAQEFPVIKNSGGIYDIPEATVKPDPSKKYKIIVDLVTGDDDPSKLSWSLNNVARMINLHSIGGVPKQNIQVVLAVHGGMTASLLNENSYKERFEVSNPHIPLYEALQQADVRVIVCGQSLRARNLELNQLIAGVEIATSMLTTVSTFHNQGYVVFKF